MADDPGDSFELTSAERAMIARDLDAEARQQAAAQAQVRARDWTGGPPLTEAERVRRRDAATAREMAAERRSEVDPGTGRRIRCTWTPA